MQTPLASPQTPPANGSQPEQFPAQQPVPPPMQPPVQPVEQPVQQVVQPTYPQTYQQPYQQTVPTAAGQQNWRDMSSQERWERRNIRHQEAGVPVWGILLILLGVAALVSNFGLDLGWLFGLALGAWFVYLGVRHVPHGEEVNWWLVGLGLLIGLGSITTGFTSHLVFPIVLIVVGVGILGMQFLRRPNT